MLFCCPWILLGWVQTVRGSLGQSPNMLMYVAHQLQGSHLPWPIYSSLAGHGNWVRHFPFHPSPQQMGNPKGLQSLYQFCRSPTEWTWLLTSSRWGGCIMFYLETLRTWVLKPAPPWICVQDPAEDRVWQLLLGGVGEAVRELVIPGDRNGEPRIHPRKAGRQWEVGPLMSSKLLSQALLSHWTSPAKHRFKDEIIENFMMVTTGH